MTYDSRNDHHSPDYDPEYMQGAEPDEGDDKYAGLNPADDIFEPTIEPEPYDEFHEFVQGEDYDYIRGLLKLMETSHVRRNAYGLLDIQTA